jgi:hypothetical protein
MKNGGWLDKYQDGGSFLGTTNVGRDYSPAWGGQFQNGGFLQPTSDKLPKGYEIPYNTPSTELAMSIGGEQGEPAYLIPSFKYGKKLKDPITEFKKTGEHLGGPFKTWQEAEKFGEMRHKYVEKGQNIPTPLKTWGDMAMGGSIPGSPGFMYARTQDPAPSNGPYAKKTKASAQDGKTMPKAYFNSPEERDEYRNRLRDISKKALESGSDENFLLETSYHQIENGNNCINGICGLNTAAGLKYNSPTDKDRYLGNTKFSDAVKKGKEDYYQVSGNFQIGDHIQYLNDKGVPHHSKEIYDITKDDKGNPEYHVIHNSGGKTFTKNIYSEKDMKDMLTGNMPVTANTYSKINIYRPGYNLDKLALDKEREASLEARAALAERKNIQEWDASHNPGFDYSIRPESKYYNKQPEGMKKFIDFANDDAKVTALAKKLNVGKDIIHDQLLNTFGELGQENKWADRWFGGTGGIENTIEHIFSPQGWSIGPGQIKYKTLDPELKKQFDINRPKDLHDINKVIPLMTAINVRNKQWMERQGENLSTKLVGIPGTSAENIKYGIDRWVPYIYQGLLSDPTTAVRKQAEANANEYRMSAKDREQYINDYVNRNVNTDRLKTFDKGSYAGRVYDLIDKNLSRTMPAQNYEQYNELMPITVKSKKKMQNGGVIKDDRGQWAHPGEITQIDSNDITMQGVNYPVLGIGADGEQMMMQPGEDYKFNKGPVTEYPMMKSGGNINNLDAQPIEKLDQLTNFTNYNKPTKGGWLDKYQ